MVLIRSAIFMIWFIVATVAIYIAVLPALLLPRKAMVHASRLWSRAASLGSSRTSTRPRRANPRG